MNRQKDCQNFHHGLSRRHEEERPQKAGAGSREGVTRSADGHVWPGIGGIKAYNIYDFFVAELEVIYHVLLLIVQVSKQSIRVV